MSKASGAEKRRQADLETEEEEWGEVAPAPKKAPTAHACEHYDMDLSAALYGTCKCGFKKRTSISLCYLLLDLSSR
jgi:hypothetical protein